MQGIEHVAVGTLRTTVVWAQARTARAGVFPANLIADHVPVPADEVGRWLNILATVRLLSRYQTVNRTLMYACQPPLAAPAPDGVRPLDTVSPREWWAAVQAAQLPRGTAHGTEIAALLDAEAGMVDRVDVLLKLAALAAAGLLQLHPAADGWHWQMIATVRLTGQAQ